MLQVSVPQPPHDLPWSSLMRVHQLVGLSHGKNLSNSMTQCTWEIFRNPNLLHKKWTSLLGMIDADFFCRKSCQWFQLIGTSRWVLASTCSQASQGTEIRNASKASVFTSWDVRSEDVPPAIPHQKTPQIQDVLTYHLTFSLSKKTWV